MIFSRDLKSVALMATVAVAACVAPPADVPRLDRAKIALSRGDGVAAEIALRELLSDGAPARELSAYFGEAELHQGKLAEARRWLEGGDFSQATSGHGYHMLARLEMQVGNLKASGQAFDNALQNTPDVPEIWVDIGRLRYRGGEHVQAVEASRRAVELGPENPAAIRFRAQLVRDAQGTAAALPWFEKAIVKNPENTDLLAEYAATLGELGRASDMLTAIRKIATIDPDNRRIYYLQAVLAARAGKFDLAQSLLSRSASEDRKAAAGQLLSAIIDIENENFASAAQTLERLAGEQPDNGRVGDLLALALSLGGNDEELVYRLAGHADRPSASPYLQTLVARSLEVLDQREEAGRLLDAAARPRNGKLSPLVSVSEPQVAEIRGSDSGAHASALVRTRIASGAVMRSVEAGEEFLDRFPGSGDALLLAADANLAAGKFNTAIARYRSAAAISRPWAISRKLVAALQVQGRRDEALAELSRYFIGNPANTEAAALLARGAFAAGDWRSAKTFADHAVRNGGSRDPVLLSLRAEIALREGKAIEALDYAETAYALQPLNRISTTTLARVYQMTKGSRRGVRIVDRLSNQGPGFDAPSYRLPR